MSMLTQLLAFSHNATQIHRVRISELDTLVRSIVDCFNMDTPEESRMVINAVCEFIRHPMAYTPDSCENASILTSILFDDYRIYVNLSNDRISEINTSMGRILSIVKSRLLLEGINNTITPMLEVCSDPPDGKVVVVSDIDLVTFKVLEFSHYECKGDKV